MDAAALVKGRSGELLVGNRTYRLFLSLPDNVYTVLARATVHVQYLALLV